MKNKYKLFSVFVLIATYCFAISVASKSSIQFVFHSNASNAHEQYFSNVSTKIFSHTLETESSITNYNSFPFPILKNYFNGFGTVLNISNKVIETLISNYCNKSEILLVKFQKTTIIFPFHYFW